MNVFNKMFPGLEQIGAAPRRFLSFLVFNVTSWECFLGSVMILHARALGISPYWVGILSAIIPFAMLVALFMKPVAERYGAKKLMIRCWTIRVIVVSPIVFTPLAYANWGTKGAAILLFSSVFLYCLLRSIGSISWVPWIHEIVPDDKRGIYTGVEAMIARLALLLLGPIIYFILGNHPALWRFSAVSALGVLLAVISLWFMRRIPGGAPYQTIKASHRNHLAEYRQVLADVNFRSFFVCVAFGTFANAGDALLAMLFMREQLGIAPGQIMLITTASSLAITLTVQRWGRIADTHGSPVTMASSAALVVVCLLICTFLRPGKLANIAIFPIFATLGLATAGFMIASARGLLHRMQPDLRNAYSALWTSGNSIFAGVSVILTGWLLNHGNSTVYLYSFIGFALIMTIISLVCLKLPESGVDYSEKTYPLFIPNRPLVSMVRMCSYVLSPKPLKEIGPKSIRSGQQI